MFGVSTFGSKKIHVHSIFIRWILNPAIYMLGWLFMITLNMVEGLSWFSTMGLKGGHDFSQHGWGVIIIFPNMVEGWSWFSPTGSKGLAMIFFNMVEGWSWFFSTCLKGGHDFSQHVWEVVMIFPNRGEGWSWFFPWHLEVHRSIRPWTLDNRTDLHHN